MSVDYEFCKKQPQVTIIDLFTIAECLGALDYPLVSFEGKRLKFNVDDTNQVVVLSFVEQEQSCDIATNSCSKETEEPTNGLF